MMKDKQLWRSIALILCVAGLMTFVHLGNLPLFDPDEPVYAETAREMLQFNDFVSPRIYGEFWYDKPPMYYWLVAGAFKIFGVGEFGARFPSAVLAVAGAVLVYLSGRKLFTERAGLLAALVLVTSMEYFYLSKASVTDMTLTFFLTGSLLAFLHKKSYLFYGCAALAVVTKGPIGLLFCGGIVALHLLFTGNLGRLKNMKLFTGGALFLALAAPWYLIMYHYHGMAFVDTFLGFHNVTRFLQPEHQTGTLWYFYIPVLIIGLFPWTAFLGQAFFRGLKEKGQHRNHLVFLMIWAASVFLFFSLSQTKLVSYILPMYPPLALLIGWYFDKVWMENRFSVLKGAGIILVLLVVTLEAGLFYAGKSLTAQLILPVQVTAGIFFVLVAAVGLFSYQKRFGAVFTTYVTGMLVFSGFLTTQMLPVVAPALSMKDTVKVFEKNYDGQSSVYVAKFYRPGFMFYSGMPGTEFKPDEMQIAMLNNTSKYFVIQKKNYEKFPPSLLEKVRLLTMIEDTAIFVRQAD